MTPTAIAAPARTCRKRSYPDEAEAWLALFRIALDSTWTGGRKPVRAYRYPKCPGPPWHLTSREERYR